jgi:anti-anti-sigma factor
MHVLQTPRVQPHRTNGLRALTYRVGDVAVIAVEGWLDASSVPALERALEDAFEQRHCNVVLDLHQLRSVDPTTLDVVWAGLRDAIRRGGTLGTAGLRPSLRNAMEPLLVHGLRLHETVCDAIAASHERPHLRP